MKPKRLEAEKAPEKIEAQGIQLSETAVVEKPSNDTPDYTIEVIKDFYGKVDITYLNNKDPNYVYRYLRKVDTNLSHRTGNLLLHGQGWQIVPRSHILATLKIPEKYIAPDGTYTVGDLVLSFMSKKFYLEKMAQKDKKVRDIEKMIDRRIKQGQPDIEEGKGIHETMEGKGLQTAKQLGMK